ncbi:MAG: SDR family oxidoreductase [Anaerolineales bacterium]
MYSPAIVITGASRGIGAALALRCARAGYRVAVNYLECDDDAQQIVYTIHEMGGEAFAIKADVRNQECVQHMFGMVERKFGGCDYLVNNAHSPFEPRSIEKMQWQDFQQQLDGSLKSAFLCCQAALPLLKSGGAILNMSSVTVRAPTSGFASRSAAKGAVEALTRNLAFELADRNIRVNVLSIGWTATNQVKALPVDFVRSNVGRAAMRRLATPEEIANTAFYYVSPEFSFITGCTIPVDGGCFV